MHTEANPPTAAPSLTRHTPRVAALVALALSAACTAGAPSVADGAEELAGLGFPYQLQFLDVSAHFTEANLRYDAQTNPDGIFVSDDADTSDSSDAEARRELVELGQSGARSWASYVDVGDPEGDPIILFHGVPTYSYLWRDVIPWLEPRGRVIAFDQLGQGFSSKHDITYTFKQHLAHAEAVIDELGLDPTRKITVVGHDTGGPLAFAFAARHPGRIKGLVFFETLYGPIPSESALPTTGQFFRSQAGRDAIVGDNLFIENLIIRSSETVPPGDRPFTIRAFAFHEILAYWLPYALPRNRAVLARWPSEIPVADQPGVGIGAPNLALFQQFAGYLATTDTPKLYFRADPGVLNPGPISDAVEATMNTGNSLSVVDLGAGFHFLQEDYPERIGQEIARWLRELDGEPEQPSAAFPYESHTVQVLGSDLHYIDEGQGAPILLLHGNPTSSYLWRNIVPFLAPRGRVIALDLVGMGGSDKPDIDYTYADHIQFVEGFIDALGLEDIVLVVHDWGSALGLDYAARHPDNVRGIAMMEAILPPMWPAQMSELPPFLADFFTTMRDPVLGPQLVLHDDIWFEQVLPDSVLRPMSTAEMDRYRAPYPTPATRAPLLAWPLQVPIDGTPADVVSVVEDYSAWLLQSDVPKLHVHVTPGVLNPPELVAYLADRLTNYETVHVGAGLHFLQEDHPEAIGLAIADWLQRVVER